jgi:hypothetical protein
LEWVAVLAILSNNWLLLLFQLPTRPIKTVSTNHMDAETKRVTIRSRARHLRRAKSGSFQQNARLRIVERNPWICAVQRAASYFTLRMRMLQEVTLFLLLAFFRMRDMLRALLGTA